MEGFGQRATSRSKLTKQTWAVLHGRGGLEDGKGWGQAAVGTGHLCDTGWGCAAVLGKALGPGKRGRGQFPSEAFAAAQGSAWKFEEDLTAALRLSWLLFVPPLALHPSPAFYPPHPLLSPQLCFNPGGDTSYPQCDPLCLISPCK